MIVNSYWLQSVAEARTSELHRRAEAWRLAEKGRSARRRNQRPWWRRSRIHTRAEAVGGGEPGSARRSSAPARYLVIARIPVAGVELFADYERRVLPLLGEYGGALRRRLVSLDRTVEAHLLEFGSDERLLDYSNDPRRLAAAPLLERSGAKVEVLGAADLSISGEPS